jgi:NADH dehydrogenase
VLWLIVHIMYLVGFKNRVTTVFHWAVSFLGRGRAERASTQHHLLGAHAGQGLQVPDEPAPAEPAVRGGSHLTS